MRSLRRCFFCVLLIFLFWASGLFWFATSLNNYALGEDVNADAIIVLTGGGGRVEYGLELLSQKRGKALFISGVNKNVPLGDLINKAPMGVRELIGVASLGRITLGHDATNTIGNAEESAQWMKQREYQSALLVTADYHMPRSLVEFRASIHDAKLIPAAVSTRNYSNLSWLNESTTRTLILSEYHKLIASYLRHFYIQMAGPA